MHTALLKSLLVACLVLAANQSASAGLLRERLLDRMAEHQPHDALALPAGAQVLHDVAYGDDPRQRYDVYLPPQAHNAPVIFMVHGGAWRIGDKAYGNVVQNKVARWLPRGFIFISVNYRLLPQADLQQQADDVAHALAAAQAKAASWGGDPAKFILMGHSAGGHLVALLSAAPERALKLGAHPWLGSVLLDSAALDVAQIMQGRHLQLYDDAFGTQPAYWQALSPIEHLDAHAPPMLAVCSSRRDDSCPQAQAFVAKAGSLGIKAQVLTQDLSHREINEQLGSNPGYTRGVEDFMGSLNGAVAQALRGAAS